MGKLKHVILIDDDIDFVKLTKKVVKQTDLVEHIEGFSHAETALDYVKKLYFQNGGVDKGFPEIIFLDINMPEIEGCEFLDKLQQFSGGSDNISRIVVLSTTIAKKHRLKALSYDIHSFIVKPLTEGNLKNIIRSLYDPIF